MPLKNKPNQVRDLVKLDDVEDIRQGDFTSYQKVWQVLRPM